MYLLDFARSVMLLFIYLNSRPIESALNSTRIMEIFKEYEGHIHLIPRIKGKTLKLRLGFYLRNMVPLTFLNNHIFVEMDLMEQWEDKRLRYKATSPHDVVTLQNQDTDSIWKPDIYIVNEKAVKHETFPEVQSAAWIFPDGKVFFFMRLSVTVYCPMSMRLYPFDKQTCNLNFESYAYNSTQLNLGLLDIQNKSHVFMDHPFTVARFLFNNYSINLKQVDYGLTGFFDQINLQIYLKRDIRYYIMEFYFPIICLVFLSFTSFWIYFKATPARVALPVTTFLTLTNMLEHVRQSSSILGSAYALEIFLNVSNVFVFAVLVQYGLVGFTDRRWSKTPKRRIQDPQHCIEYSNESVLKEESNEKTIHIEAETTTAGKDGKSSFVVKGCCNDLLKIKHQKYREEVHLLDKICRYVFPVTYIIFLIGYSIICIINLI